MVCLLVDSSMEPLARSKSLSSLSDAVQLHLGTNLGGMAAQGQKRSVRGEDSPPPKRTRPSPVPEQAQLATTQVAAPMLCGSGHPQVTGSLLPSQVTSPRLLVPWTPQSTTGSLLMQRLPMGLPNLRIGFPSPAPVMPTTFPNLLTQPPLGPLPPSLFPLVSPIATQSMHTFSPPFTVTQFQPTSRFPLMTGTSPPLMSPILKQATQFPLTFPQEIAFVPFSAPRPPTFPQPLLKPPQKETDYLRQQSPPSPQGVQQSSSPPLPERQAVKDAQSDSQRKKAIRKNTSSTLDFIPACTPPVFDATAGLSEQMVNVMAMYQVKMSAEEESVLQLGHGTGSQREEQQRKSLNPELWSFFLELLTNEEHYHKIRWVNSDVAEFAILDNEDVAHLWGQTKNKPNMNYDTMSRGIRYYYNQGIVAKGNNMMFKYNYCYTEVALAKLCENTGWKLVEWYAKDASHAKFLHLLREFYEDIKKNGYKKTSLMELRGKWHALMTAEAERLFPSHDEASPSAPINPDDYLAKVKADTTHTSEQLHELEGMDVDPNES